MCGCDPQNKNKMIIKYLLPHAFKKWWTNIPQMVGHYVGIYRMDAQHEDLLCTLM
jgi:hypothetical protein